MRDSRSGEDGEIQYGSRVVKILSRPSCPLELPIIRVPAIANVEIEVNPRFMALISDKRRRRA